MTRTRYSRSLINAGGVGSTRRGHPGVLLTRLGEVDHLAPLRNSSIAITHLAQVSTLARPYRRAWSIGRYRGPS